MKPVIRKFSRKIETDILIVGGGVPGLSLAAAIQQNMDVKITMVDKELSSQSKEIKYYPGRLPDARIISLNEASLRYLQFLGVDKEIDYRLMNKIDRIKAYETYGSCNLVMDSKKNVTIPFVTSNSEEFLFYTVEIVHLVDALVRTLDWSKITLVNDLTMTMDNTKVDSQENYSTLEVGDERFEAELIVAADGANSIIRRKLNMPFYGFNYNETGLVATFVGNRPSNVAFQRFMHNGIFALLPLYDNLYSIVCSLPAQLNEKLMSMPEDKFIEIINSILHSPSKFDFSHLQRLVSGNDEQAPIIERIVSKRLNFPLKFQTLSQFYSGSTVFMGDAAHSIHPMAGQGLNQGILESAILSDLLIEGEVMGRRVNDVRSIELYSSKAKQAFGVQSAGQEIIKKIYANDSFPLSLIRNVGSTLLNASETAKSILTSQSSRKGFLPERYI